jgi:Glycosyltransferase family 36
MRVARGWDDADSSPRNVCLLSNGRYGVMLTESGSGYSTYDEWT